jgi:hypothetical protein
MTCSRYRKKQKNTNTYNICDKRRSKATHRNLKSRNHIHEKFETRKTYNLYRMNVKLYNINLIFN